MRFFTTAFGSCAFLFASLTLANVSDRSLAAGAQYLPGPALLSSDAPVAEAPAAPRLDDPSLSLDDSDLSQRPQGAPSLAALVRQQSGNGEALDAEARCLASAIFYEARSESLAGKLAVARVIVNRSRSGRFPTSLCGVVTQPGQFSFVRSGQIPAVSNDSAGWHDSVGIARIAMDDSWKSPAEGALFFHARRVSPRWGRQMLAQVDNHLFYR